MDKRFIDCFIDVKGETTEGEDRIFHSVITSNICDRQQEVLLPSGCDFSEFKNNPICIWSHQYDIPGIGTWSNWKAVGNTIEADCRITKATAFANDIWNLIADEVIRCVSIGFYDVEQRKPTKKDVEMFGKDVVKVISKYKLLEISVVNIPANQQALITAVGKNLLSIDKAKELFNVEIKAADLEAHKTPSPVEPETNTEPAPVAQKTENEKPCCGGIEDIERKKIDEAWSEIMSDDEPKPKKRKKIIIIPQPQKRVDYRGIVEREVKRALGKLF